MSRIAVGSWMMAVSASICGIILVGGYTRLSKSGLSMVEWKPATIYPPQTDEEWEIEFEKYK